VETSSERVATHAEGSRLRAVIASADDTSAPTAPALDRAAFAALIGGAKSPAAAQGHIDHVYDAALSGAELLTPSADEAWMESGTVMRVVGWALDERRQPLQAVALTLGDALVVCDYGLSRPDLIQAFGSEEVGRCGFSVPLDTADFAPGQYEARAFGIDAGGALVAVPLRLELHFAVLRPAAEFAETPLSPALELALDDPRPGDPGYGVPDRPLHVRGRAFDRAANCPFAEVAALTDAGDLIRGQRRGGPRGERFEIVIPTAGRAPGPLNARIVALGPSGRAELALPPRPIVPAVPGAFLGLRPLRSAAHVRARMRAARGPNGRIDIEGLTVEGHAHDPATGSPLRAIAFRVRRAGGPAYPPGAVVWGTYGFPRADAAGVPEALRDTGFTVTIDKRDLHPGEYTVEALAVPHGLRGYLVPEPVASFAVDDPRPARRLRRARAVRPKPGP
jgi:hypothetical protein